MDNKQVKKYKKDFPIFKNNKNLVYLDNAATSQRPQQVIDVVTKFYEKENANIHRGLYTLSNEATEKYEKARKAVANFINANTKEIVFTRNATEALNLLGYTISSLFKHGKDEIVLTEMEHHSNLIPWQQLAKRRKMKLKIIKVKDDFTLDLEDAKRKITSRTALVSIVHASNVLGTINPVNEIFKLAKEKGAFTILDAAQSVPHMEIDVKKLNCDFLAFSSHKMLGPTGIGVLYGKKQLLEKLPPFNFGGGMIKRVEYGNAEWADIPSKFEAGTQNIAEAIGLAEAIKYLEKVGFKNIENHEKKIMSYILDELSQLDGVEIYNPGADKSIGVLSFNIKGVHSHDVASLMNESGIAIRAGHNCVMPLMIKMGLKGGVARASFYFYNTLDEAKKFIQTFKKVKRLFNK